MQFISSCFLNKDGQQFCDIHKMQIYVHRHAVRWYIQIRTIGLGSTIKIHAIMKLALGSNVSKCFQMNENTNGVMICPISLKYTKGVVIGWQSCP